MKYPIFLAAALLFSACNSDKTTEAGVAGVNAGAAAGSEAADAANPMVDNPNVVSENETPNPNAPVMKFTEAEFDFGDIQPNSKVSHTFKFVNVGKSPLLIEDASASCGCTTPSWTKEPVAPNGQGEMEVVFDSQGKQGIFSKQVAVRANTQPGITTILVKGNIVTPATK